MKKLIVLASGIRLHAVLCGAAAVLLSACGAGVSDPINGQQSQTAAELTSDTARPTANNAANNAAAMPYGAEAAPAVADVAAPALPAAASAAPPVAPVAAAPATATNIEPAYDSKRQSASTTGFSDQTDAPVEVAQETAAAACDTGSCQH